MIKSILPVAALAVVLNAIALAAADPPTQEQPPVVVKATRLGDGPILRPDMMPKDDGVWSGNLNFPCVIRVPDWVERPLGKYYLYFSAHHGSYIRLAYADHVTGPWKIYEPGTLRLEQVERVNGADRSRAAPRRLAGRAHRQRAPAVPHVLPLLPAEARPQVVGRLLDRWPEVRPPPRRDRRAVPAGLPPRQRLARDRRRRRAPALPRRHRALQAPLRRGQTSLNRQPQDRPLPPRRPPPGPRPPRRLLLPRRRRAGTHPVYAGIAQGRPRLMAGDPARPRPRARTRLGRRQGRSCPVHGDGPDATCASSATRSSSARTARRTCSTRSQGRRGSRWRSFRCRDFPAR